MFVIDIGVLGGGQAAGLMIPDRSDSGPMSNRIDAAGGGRANLVALLVVSVNLRSVRSPFGSRFLTSP